MLKIFVVLCLVCAFAYAQFNDEAQNSSPDLEVAESANPQYGYGGYGGRGGGFGGGRGYGGYGGGRGHGGYGGYGGHGGRGYGGYGFGR